MSERLPPREWDLFMRFVFPFTAVLYGFMFVWLYARGARGPAALVLFTWTVFMTIAADGDRPWDTWRRHDRSPGQDAD